MFSYSCWSFQTMNVNDTFLSLLCAECLAVLLNCFHFQISLRCKRYYSPAFRGCQGLYSHLLVLELIIAVSSHPGRRKGGGGRGGTRCFFSSFNANHYSAFCHSTRYLFLLGRCSIVWKLCSVHYQWEKSNQRPLHIVISRGAVRSVVSSYAAVRMVAGLRPVLVIAWEWHIGLALLCGCSGALEYPTTNSCGPINKSLSLSLSLF